MFEWSHPLHSRFFRKDLDRQSQVRMKWYLTRLATCFTWFPFFCLFLQRISSPHAHKTLVPGFCDRPGFSFNWNSYGSESLDTLRLRQFEWKFADLIHHVCASNSILTRRAIRGKGKAATPVECLALSHTELVDYGSPKPSCECVKEVTEGGPEWTRYAWQGLSLGKMCNQCSRTWHISRHWLRNWPQSASPGLLDCSRPTPSFFVQPCHRRIPVYSRNHIIVTKQSAEYSSFIWFSGISGHV